MSLFDSIHADDGHRSIELGVQRLLERADSRGFGRRRVWSLAELHPDEADYRWLLNWAEALHWKLAKDWLSGTRKIRCSSGSARGEEAIGLLFLFLFAEKARRDASEDNLWSVLGKGLFGERTRDNLFQPRQHYPRPPIRQALGAAAYRFNLRHVFAQVGDVHAWKGLIFLQFGFSLCGARGQLPNWLAGNWPRGVSRLFEGELRADSFRDLWNTLTEYRQENTSQGEFERRLRESPWVLPEWTRELGQQAKQKRSLGTRPLDKVERAAEAHCSDTEVEAETEEHRFPLLTEPRLRWRRGEEPQFEARFHPDAVSVDPGTYRLKVGGKKVAHVLVDAEGEARVDPPRDWIRLPQAAPAVPVSLHGDRGVAMEPQELELWPADLDVVLCSWDGEIARVLGDADTVRLKPGKRYSLLTGADLELSPPGPDWRDLGDTEMRLHVLDPGALAWCELRWNGAVVWRPAMEGQPKKAAPAGPPVTEITAYPVKPGRDRWVRITHPGDVIVHEARLGTHDLRVERQTLSRTEVGPLPDDITGQKDLRLRVERDGEPCSMKLKVDVCQKGAWLLQDTGWKWFAEEDLVDIADLGSRRLKVGCDPNTSEGRSGWWILEGNTSLRELRMGTLVVSGAEGLGGALLLRRDRFQDREPDLPLCRLVDRGKICSVRESRPGTWEVRLREDWEPDEDTSVVAWAWDAAPQVLKPEPVASDCLKIHTNGSPLAVGLAYDGERIGAWWHDQWWLALKGAEVCSTARWLRWLRLPLLLREARWSVVEFVRRDPAAVLGQWLLDSDPPGGLSWTASQHDGWRDAVRDLTWDWKPTCPEVTQLAMKLGRSAPGLQQGSTPKERAFAMFAETASLLAKWHPLLMGRMLEHLPANRSGLETEIRARLGLDSDRFQLDDHQLRAGNPLITKAMQAENLDPEVLDLAMRMAVRLLPYQQLLAWQALQEPKGRD